MHFSKRNWLIIGVTYIVVFFACNILFGPGIDKAPLSPYQAIFFAPIFWWFSLFCIQSGNIHTKFAHIEREDSPLAFWLNVAIVSGIGLAFFLWGTVKIIK